VTEGDEVLYKSVQLFWMCRYRRSHWWINTQQLLPD